MSRRQASTIIGLLLVILVFVAIAIYPDSSRGQHVVNLPIVASADDGAVASSYSVTPTGKIGEILVRRNGPLYAVAVIMTGTLTDALHTPYDTKMAEAMEQLNKENAIKDESVAMTGPATEGSVIEIAGRRVDLPDGFYVDAYHQTLMCQVDTKCLQAPVYAIGNIKTGHILGVSAKTGDIGSPSLSADELATLRSEFNWLVVAMNTSVLKIVHG